MLTVRMMLMGQEKIRYCVEANVWVLVVALESGLRPHRSAYHVASIYNPAAAARQEHASTLDLPHTFACLGEHQYGTLLDSWPACAHASGTHFVVEGSVLLMAVAVGRSLGCWGGRAQNMAMPGASSFCHDFGLEDQPGGASTMTGYIMVYDH